MADCKCSPPSHNSLQSLCWRQERINGALLGRIIEEEEKSQKRASQQLEQYNRVECNAQAFLTWREMLQRESHQDLQELRQQMEKQQRGLCVQLETCNDRLHKALKELYCIRDYKEREQPMNALQIASLRRQLQKLHQANKDKEADNQLLAKTEIKKCLEKTQDEKFQALQRMVEHHLGLLPLTVKRMCIENQDIKQQMCIYQQEVQRLQEEVAHLLEKERSLRKSYLEDREEILRELMIGRPSCPPDEDPALDIPLTEHLPI